MKLDEIMARSVKQAKNTASIESLNGTPTGITIVDSNGTPVLVPDGCIALVKSDGTYQIIKIA